MVIPAELRLFVESRWMVANRCRMHRESRKKIPIAGKTCRQAPYESGQAPIYV